MASRKPIDDGINSLGPETVPEDQYEPEENFYLSEEGTTVETEHEAEAELEASEMAAERELIDKLETTDQNGSSISNVNKWPGWPGDCVFRLVVPVLKVGSIIGRKGELIKKMCEETRARIRVLDGPISSPDRIVLISGKEEPEAPLSPAMDAVIRVFKRLSGLQENEGGGMTAAAAVGFSSMRLLVASTQAINLIGKQGSLIKSIQESTSASVRVLSSDETPSYVSPDERIVELQGEAFKVLKALEAVVGHLRKFLVDHSVLPLFEKNYNISSSQERLSEPWSDKPLLLSNPHGGRSTDYPPLPLKRDSAFFERESHLEPQVPSSVSLFGQDHGNSGIRTSAFSRGGGPIVTQVSQTMQIPLDYAEDIIGVQGTNIAYIRRTSGAILTVQESRGLPDEITVEIKGTSSQVQTAQQLIQEFISGRKEPHILDSGLRASYSQLGSTSYSLSSYSGQPYGSYGSSGVGGYSSFRL